MNGDEFKGRGGGGKWSEKRRNDWKRWNWQGRDVKCFLGLWEKKFCLSICSIQTSLQAEFNTRFCMIAQKLKMVKNPKRHETEFILYFSKRNYKAFNHLCCPDRVTLWNHEQIRKCSVRSKFFQHQKEQKALHAFSAPEDRNDTKTTE